MKDFLSKYVLGYMSMLFVRRIKVSGCHDICFKDLQNKARFNSLELNVFFWTQGGFVPSNDVLIIYKELATRILKGTGGAYQRVNKITAAVLVERIKLIDDALYWDCRFKNLG